MPNINAMGTAAYASWQDNQAAHVNEASTAQKAERTIMSYEIMQIDRSGDSFGNYNYCIYESGRLVARYWHDYRGDDHGIEIVGGVSESSPVGRMIDFLEGGGSTPTVLSLKAVDYLNLKLATLREDSERANEND